MGVDTTPQLFQGMENLIDELYDKGCIDKEQADKFYKELHKHE
jgi:polyhydroxyalkanoate synthesis regulator phasin